jgi:hypothetical protein
MSWGVLFERAGTVDVTVEAVRAALVDRRASPVETATDDAALESDSGGDESDARTTGAVEATDPLEPGPARVVADADVLAADLLVGGDAREALDTVRAHSWVVLVASDPLVDDAAAVVATLADADLAADWRATVERLREAVGQPADDHPALASAYRGGAMHVLTYADDLRSAGAGAAIRDHVETSVKHPGAFATLFDAESLYATVEGGPYPGPDRDPRA